MYISIAKALYLNKKNHILICISLIFIVSKALYAQNESAYGKFNGIYYSIKDFGSAHQIWTGVQGSNKSLFFGNSQEILHFNGHNWSKLKVDPSIKDKNELSLIKFSKVSKLFTSSKGITYVGRKDNIGIIDYSSTGELIYYPLIIAEKQDEIGEVWNIVEHKNRVYIIAEKKVFYFEGRKHVEIKLPKVTQDYSCKTSAKLDHGIFLIYSRNKQKEDLPNKKYYYLDFSSLEVHHKTIPTQNSILNVRGVEKVNSSFYLFDYTGTVNKLKESNGKLIWEDVFQLEHNSKTVKPNVVKKIKNHFYVGTEDQGVLVYNSSWKVIRTFDFKEGMENNNVFDLFSDFDGNLWFNLDNGIHFFETSSPLTSFEKQQGIIAPIQAIDFGLGIPSLASNSDLLFLNIERQSDVFENSNILQESAYDLKTFETKFGKKTLVVGYNGIYEVTRNSKRKIIDIYAWCLFQNPLNKNQIFIGTETGLASIELDNNTWKFNDQFNELGGDVIHITHFNSHLYFGVRGKGVYQFSLKSNSTKLIPFKKSSQNNNHFYVEEFQEKIYVGVQSGLYILKSDLSGFDTFNELNRKFTSNDELQVHRIFNQDNKKLWLVTYRDLNENEFEFEFGYLTNQTGWSWTTWPMKGYESAGIVNTIHARNEQEIWFGCNNGLFILNADAINSFKKSYTLSFDMIKSSEKIITLNPLITGELKSIPYSENSIRFSFHTNSTNGLGKMKYRYRLIGLSDDWSEWTNLNTVNFQKLSEGNYEIQIQGKNQYDLESQTLLIKFTVLPPWYRSWWAYTIYVFILFLVIYLITQLSLQQVKKQNLKLEATVLERTSEIAEQNQILAEQKLEIERKTNDIVDSIIYAKRIQETILPKERLKEMFQDYFVFYRPKDIVSGDFYWARKKGDLIIFSTIDCTGHGVPGALVSIVGNSALLRCVNEHKLAEPAEILEKLREIVVKSFDTKGEVDVKDGMDMSLCTLDTQKLILKFAGANNECVIIRDKEIIELKPDKQPIGHFTHEKPFTQQEFKLQKGDCIYQYTDGYVDQFGGEKGKKLKSRPFKEFLVSISQHDMNTQHKLVQEMFDNWKEGYDQVDDVCVFGVKI
jgi:serine phosphatase RsbU (regulator of sigma subunit)